MLMLGLGLAVTESAAQAGGDCMGFSTFSDNFEGDTPASGTKELGKTSWLNWQVFSGSVDFYTLAADADFTAPGATFAATTTGKFVDLDGSSNQAGFFYHTMTFPTGQFTLSFSEAGTQRAFSPTDTLRAYIIPVASIARPLPAATSTAPIAYQAAWGTVTLAPTFKVNAAGTYAIGFQNLPEPGASSDNAGVLIDNVQLSCAQRGPMASFSLTSPGTCQDSTVTATSTSTDPQAGITSSSWTFGDATPAQSGATTTHTYTATGAKTVSLTITDSLGATDTATQTWTSIGDPNCCPVVTPLGDFTANEGQVLQFTATATDFENDAMTFSLGGTIPSGATINPATGAFQWTDGLGSAGIYPMQMRASDAGCTGSTPFKLTVGPDRPPTGLFAADPIDGVAGQTVTFVDSSTDPDQGDVMSAWDWNFGDGALSHDSRPLHIYGNAGSFSACLTPYDRLGLVGTKGCRTIHVAAPNPSNGNGGSSGSGGSAGGSSSSSSSGSGSQGTDSNLPPTAPPPAPLTVDAGRDRMVNPGSTVSLHAQTAASGVTYRWAQTSGPSVALQGATTSVVTFQAPTVSEPTTFYLEVAIEDGSRGASDGVAVTVQPTASGLQAQVVGQANADAGSRIALDGSASTGATSYHWTQWEGPAVVLDDASSATPSFNAPSQATQLRFALEVGNGQDTSVAVETVWVAVAAPTAAPSATAPKASDMNPPRRPCRRRPQPPRPASPPGSCWAAQPSSWLACWSPSCWWLFAAAPGPPKGRQASNAGRA